MAKFHLHLVSDSTGETLSMIAQAVWARFNLADPIESIYALTRTREQVQQLLKNISSDQPSMVMSTLVDDEIRQFLEEECKKISVPCIAVLDQIAETISHYLGVKIEKRPPGGQHIMDGAYFNRLKALSYVLTHDDGQQMENLDEADVILIGLSRTSKTPTCFYLAHRGIKAANVPLVPGIVLPEILKKLTAPLIVGLMVKPTRLVQMRQHRFVSDIQAQPKAGLDHYTDITQVTKESNDAYKIFKQNDWPILDVTQRSVEETAAAILNLKRERDEGNRL